MCQNTRQDSQRPRLGGQFRAEDVSEYFGTPFGIENPWTGLLRTRPVIQGIPYVRCDYCRYGSEYRKQTALWTNVPCNLLTCDGKCGMIVDGRHRKTAQRGPGLRGVVRMTDDSVSLDTLHALPARLCKAIFEATSGVRRHHLLFETEIEHVLFTFGRS